MSVHEPLLEPSFLRRLDALRLVSRRPVSSPASGSRRSARRGTSTEFADFREYVPGDDLRAVDWNAYGRLEKLFLKLFVDEEDLALHLLLDLSGSMAFGAPTAKSLYAKQLAAALGYVALARADRVCALNLGGTMPGPPSFLRGMAGVGTLFQSLQSMPVQGQTDAARALGRYAAQAKMPGTAVVFSDFYDDGWARGLQALHARRFSVVLVHILTPFEMRPNALGNVRLTDAETMLSQETTLSPDAVAQYDARLQVFLGSLQTLARRYAMDYVRLETDLSLEKAIRQLSGPGGVLR